MNQEQMMKRIAIALIATLAFSMNLPVASAANMVVKPSKVNDLAAEENISITLEKFPSRAGVYLQQCEAAVGNARPENCNAQTQLWISNSRGASFTPTSAITMKLVSKFGSVDCTTQKCGIFARYDHTAGTDTTEDQFIPITFSTSAAPAAPVQVVAQKQSLPTLPKSIKAGKRLSLPLQTEQGITLTYRTASSKICTVKDNVVRALRAGNCALQIFAPASDKFEMLASNYRLRVSR